MSYMTRKVVREKQENIDGFPPAVHRFFQTIDWQHESGKNIRTTHENSKGCAFQLGFFAVPGSELSIGTPGKPNSVHVTVSNDTVTVKIYGGRKEETLTCPFSHDIVGDCDIPCHTVVISVYRSWYTFGIVIGDEYKQVASKAYGGGLSLANRIFINGSVLEYSRCYGVQVFVSDTELKSFKDISKIWSSNESRDLYARFKHACVDGEVWEEWTVDGRQQMMLTLASDKDLSDKCARGTDFHTHIAAGKYTNGNPRPVDSCTRSINAVHENNLFHWERPEKARSVHLAICGSGDGGSANTFRLSPPHELRASPGLVKMYTVQDESLDFYVYEGGAGAGKKNNPPAEKGRPTVVVGKGWTSDGGELWPSVRTTPWFFGANTYALNRCGARFGAFPYICGAGGIVLETEGHRVGANEDNTGLFLGYGLSHGWTWGAGGYTPNNTLDLEYYPEAGKGGYRGVALFHYLF